MSISVRSKEVLLATPPVSSALGSPPPQSFRSTHFNESVDMPNCLAYLDSRVPSTTSDNRHAYLIGRPQPTNGHLTSHSLQSVAPNAVSATSAVAATSTPVYLSMSYSSAPASFGACPYMAHDHASDMKDTYSSESRNGTVYMRVDFNPIAESLNFSSNPTAYDALPNDGFGGWSATSMNADPDPKLRPDFRPQNIGASVTCSGLPCQSEEFQNHQTSPPDQIYPSNNRRLSSTGRSQETERFDLLTLHRDSVPSCISTFECHGYGPINARSHNPKMFNVPCAGSLGSNAGGRGCLNLTRTAMDTGSDHLLRSHPSTPSSSNPTILAVSANETSISNPAMMTPDSSTTGFLSHKFGTSSDDGEVSPTPTNGSGQFHNGVRVRKAAPTLATGRRNLKNEPVDPDEADRRMKRRERNRKSAQKCRERKVQRTQELQAQVEGLQLEINRLTQERDNLRNEARQFVTLLQLHCPGVAIPYISCLSDTSEPRDAQRESCTALPQSAAALKTDTTHENIAPGWRVKHNSKPAAGVDSLNAAMPSDSFSHLPTMVSMRSHISPARSRSSVFTFPSDRTERLGSDVESHVNCLNTLGTEQVSRVQGSGKMPTVSVHGPASASSSSPCSNYELSISATELTIPHSSMINQLDSSIETVTSTPASVRDRNPVVLGSPDHSQPFLTTLSTKLPTVNNDAIRFKCEEWEHFVASRSVIAGKSDHPSVVSPSSQRSLYSGVTELNGTNRCELRKTEQQTMSTRPMEGACFS